MLAVGPTSHLAVTRAVANYIQRESAVRSPRHYDVLGDKLHHDAFSAPQFLTENPVAIIPTRGGG